MEADIRWLQRFEKFEKALRQLDKFLSRAELNELEQQGLIQAFEYCYELAWNVIRDFLLYQGITDIVGSRDAFRMAFRKDLVADGEVWMDMIRSRQVTVHTYEESLAEEMEILIRERYAPAFQDLRQALRCASGNP